MSIAKKINSVIKQMSSKEIDSTSQKELQQLTQAQVELYIRQAQELKRGYYIDMLIDRDPPLGHLEQRHGTFVTWVSFNSEMGQWCISSGAGLIPTYVNPPLMVAEDKFRKHLYELQVPMDFIEKIIEGQPLKF